MKTVQLHTSHGLIVLELDEEKAPISVANFCEYVDAGFYDNTIFHRVIAGFMIQGGGFDEENVQKSGRPPIVNEANNGLKNEQYTIAMARTSAPHSASSQFFINTVSNSFLNFKSESPSGWGYAVFGKVVLGHEVVDAIGKVKTRSMHAHGDWPVEPIVIKRAVQV